MKVKKTVKTQGGVAISDRLKLDAAPAKPAAGTIGKKSSTYALVFGCAALAVVGILTYTLYRHWEFLMPA